MRNVIAERLGLGVGRPVHILPRRGRVMFTDIQPPVVAEQGSELHRVLNEVTLLHRFARGQRRRHRLPRATHLQNPIVGRVLR